VGRSARIIVLGVTPLEETALRSGSAVRDHCVVLNPRSQSQIRVDRRCGSWRRQGLFRRRRPGRPWKGLRAVATNLEALDRTPPAGAMPAALQQRLASVPFEAAVEARFQTFVRQDRFLRVIHAVRSSDLLDNADSYSHFVMFQPDSSS
jgi:hypothetical protein